jgi:hypothetical protein
VRASYDALADVFECIENFFRRLMVYTEIPPTPAMTEVLVKIMTEILSVLGLATKQINQGRFSKFILTFSGGDKAQVAIERFAKKLLGEREIEAVLERLDRLTVEESRTTATQTLNVVHSLVNNMETVMEGVSLTRITERNGTKRQRG